MRNNTSDAQTALGGKADPNAPRDMYDHEKNEKIKIKNKKETLN